MKLEPGDSVIFWKDGKKYSGIIDSVEGDRIEIDDESVRLLKVNYE